MDTMYAEEKFIQAEHALATGCGAIKARLKEAYRCLAPLNSEDLPEHLRQEFEWIISRLTTRPPLRPRYSDTVVSGRVSQTLHWMKNKTAKGIAERIVSLRSRLADYNDTHARDTE